MFRPTGLTLRAALSKERGHLLGARPPLLRQGVFRAALLASAKTHKKLRPRKQRTYRRSSLRGEFAFPPVVPDAKVYRPKRLALAASHRPHPQTGSPGAVQQVAMVDVSEIGAILALQSGTRPIVIRFHTGKRRRPGTYTPSPRIVRQRRPAAAQRERLLHRRLPLLLRR